MSLDLRTPPPSTPDLDKVEEQLRARAQWEADQERQLAESIQRRAADAAARTVHLEKQKQRKAACEAVASNVKQNLAALVASLDDYVAASGQIPADVNHRVMILLARSLGKYGKSLIDPTVQGTVFDPLMQDLFPEVN